VESSCELGNEPSGFIKCWEPTEWLHNLWPLECCSATKHIIRRTVRYGSRIVTQVDIVPTRKELGCVVRHREERMVSYDRHSGHI
jgi:hypothetical protein